MKKKLILMSLRVPVLRERIARQPQLPLRDFFNRSAVPSCPSMVWTSGKGMLYLPSAMSGFLRGNEMCTVRKEKTMKRHVLLTFAAVATFFLAGRNGGHRSNHTGTQRHVTITTDPPRASVYQVSFIDNSPVSLGKTPLNSIPVTVLTSAKYKRASTLRVEET